MKRIFTLLLISIIATAMVAQERYSEYISDSADMSTEIYGVNATVIQIATFGEAVPQPLVMDIYQPTGDTETNRPVVLVVHTGNFLPQGSNQQISGSLRDKQIIDICTDLARRGFVAASVDYRTGWNPLAPSQPERALGIIQASYRGIQDVRAAVRYMRKLAVDGGNPYNIDPSSISAFGTGTGGYIVLGMASLDSYAEIVQTTAGPAKFLLDLDGDGAPETPMVVPAYHGDIYGLDLAVAPDGAFGLPAGDTLNYPNNVAYASGDTISSEISLGINIGGALGDISWMSNNSIPTISIQSINDEFAPYNDAVLAVPGTMLNVVRVQGAQAIGQAQKDNGANQVFYDATFNDPVTQLAMDNSGIAGHEYYEGVFPWTNEPNIFGLDEGVPIEWWDPNEPSPAYLDSLQRPWNVLPHPSPAAMGASFHDVGQLRNVGMSADKARATIATCMEYIIPRTCVALELGCQWKYIMSDTEELLDENLISVSPNPASNVINIKSDEASFSEVILTDISGRIVYRKNNLNQYNHAITELEGISGMHILSVRFEDGVVNKKLLVE